MIKSAQQNISDILKYSIKHDEVTANSLVIYDTENGLTEILREAYRNSLPKGKFLDFKALNKETVLLEFEKLKPLDLVVLIQSSNFRLDDFRIRLHLFNKGVKVIEHMHLYRNTQDQWQTYIDSLAYDPKYYQVKAQKIVEKLSKKEGIENNQQPAAEQRGISLHLEQLL
jgi:aminopeptidase